MEKASVPRKISGDDVPRKISGDDRFILFTDQTTKRAPSVFYMRIIYTVFMIELFLSSPNYRVPD